MKTTTTNLSPPCTRPLDIINKKEQGIYNLIGSKFIVEIMIVIVDLVQ